MHGFENRDSEELVPGSRHDQVGAPEEVRVLRPAAQETQVQQSWAGVLVGEVDERVRRYETVRDGALAEFNAQLRESGVSNIMIGSGRPST